MSHAITIRDIVHFGLTCGGVLLVMGLVIFAINLLNPFDED